MDEDRFPSNFSDRFEDNERREHHRGHHHHAPHHGKPTRLIVFFLENESPRDAIEDNLLRISGTAHTLRSVFLHFFGPNVPDSLRERSAHLLKEIHDFIKNIRGEVISMTTTPIQPPAGSVNQLLLTDTVGILVAILEADDSGANFFPPVGPLQFAVSDPSGTVTQGVAADGVTPTFLPNGSGNTGDVTVEVTDAGNNLVGSGSFSVVSGTPPPPPGATQLGVFFQPNPSGAPSTGAGSTGATSDAVKAAAAAKASGTATTVDPHHTKQ